MKDYSLLFWDFDGVIKESVSIKADAFERLFARFGAPVAALVREHHERHTGMSRYEKLPLYLQWAGAPNSVDAVARYERLFALEVRQAVIDCPWVPGAREYLQANHPRQRCVLVTATPQEEIESILTALDIAHCFREVHGAPLAKAEVIGTCLSRLGCCHNKALFIGDSESDLEAARVAGVDFLLRCTALNGVLQRTYQGRKCADFTDGGLRDI